MDRDQDLLVPPHDLELELSLLSALIIAGTGDDPDDDAMAMLRPEYFYRTAHQKIFAAMTSIRDRHEPIDANMIRGELKARGDYDAVGGTVYLSQILSYPPAVDQKLYVNKIIGFWKLRRAIENCQTVMKEAFRSSPDDADEILERSIGRVELITAGKSDCWRPIGDYLLDCIDKTEELRRNKCYVTGVPTGFTQLDHILCGLQPTDLIVVAARPGMGKTAFALNSMINAGRKGFSSGILSLEMSGLQLTNRAISSESRTDGARLRTGFVDQHDYERIIDAADRLNNSKIYIDDSPRAHFRDIERKAATLIRKRGSKALWIDYLGFIDGDNPNRKVDEIQSITRAIKATAKRFEIPIVLLCQLSRKCEERNDKRPILSDLRDSGAIEQDADVVMFLYRDEVYNQEDTNPHKGIVEVAVAKQRNGPTGMARLAWLGNYTRLENLAIESYNH